jgi:hypothetical protein
MPESGSCRVLAAHLLNGEVNDLFEHHEVNAVLFSLPLKPAQVQARRSRAMLAQPVQLVLELSEARQGVDHHVRFSRCRRDEGRITFAPALVAIVVVPEADD